MNEKGPLTVEQLRWMLMDMPADAVVTLSDTGIKFTDHKTKTWSYINVGDGLNPVYDTEHKLQHERELNPMWRVMQELRYANSRFPAFNSTHEGWAILHEEEQELWELVKLNPDKIENIPLGWNTASEFYAYRLREEASQVGAMALKFLQHLDAQYPEKG